MLKIGAPAPGFEFEDQLGRKGKFPGDFKGKWLGLIFLRTLACPLCMEKLEELKKNEQKYKDQGVEVFVVVQSTLKRTKDYGARKGINFRLLADLERKIYGLYEVALGGLSAFMAPQVMTASLRATFKGHLHGLPEGNELQKPAAFIIDPQGKLVFSDYGKNIADMLSEEKFFQMLAQLKQGKKV